mmetsp:Transcript_24717/g.49566  ORF Transcript_24717/g.49566 Transcript_24717/m.49566 type:complete len:92 (-) Transcript_24717:676-951(-)
MTVWRLVCRPPATKHQPSGVYEYATTPVAQVMAVVAQLAAGIALSPFVVSGLWPLASRLSPLASPLLALPSPPALTACLPRGDPQSLPGFQ